jgi:hypothetical protein
MKSQSERHAHWQKLVEEQIQSGLSRREFCDRNQIVLSQFSYYYLEFKKKEHRKMPGSGDVLPIHLRQKPLVPASREIKVLLPNGLQVVLPCGDSSQLKQWVEALRSC